MRYILVSDDSCHSYVIPEEKSKEWYDWLEDEDNWDQPSYATRIDGYLSFTDPKFQK